MMVAKNLGITKVSVTKVKWKTIGKHLVPLEDQLQFIEKRRRCPPKDGRIGLLPYVIIVIVNYVFPRNKSIKKILFFLGIANCIAIFSHLCKTLISYHKIMQIPQCSSTFFVMVNPKKSCDELMHPEIKI